MTIITLLTRFAVRSDGVQRAAANSRISAVTDTRAAVETRDVVTRLGTAFVYIMLRTHIFISILNGGKTFKQGKKAQKQIRETQVTKSDRQ